MIDNNGCALLADFSLLTVISDQDTLLSTCIEGGTIPWMSPELLDPESFGFVGSRLTKESDCYALGMVIYEVLSGWPPFAPSKSPIRNILNGGRPRRPQGARGARFTDSIWEILELCWEQQPNDRPSLNTVLQYLQDITRPSGPSSADVDGDIEADVDDKSATTSSDSSTFSLLSSRSRIYDQQPLRHDRYRLHVV